MKLEGDQARLYELIWKRAMASQMESASIERTSVDFVEPTGKVELRATGQVILFDGFLALYQEGRDDEEDEENRRLPQLKQGERVDVRDVKADQHFTEPPPRYLGSEPRQEAGRTRHRPAVHLRGNPGETARTQVRDHGQEPLHPG